MANNKTIAAKLDDSALENVIGGVRRDSVPREKFVSAFYCEACGKTIHLNMIYSLDRAKKEHNKQFHPFLP